MAETVMQSFFWIERSLKLSNEPPEDGGDLQNLEKFHHLLKEISEVLPRMYADFPSLK